MEITMSSYLFSPNWFFTPHYKCDLGENNDAKMIASLAKSLYCNKTVHYSQNTQYHEISYNDRLQKKRSFFDRSSSSIFEL